LYNTEAGCSSTNEIWEARTLTGSTQCLEVVISSSSMELDRMS